MNNPNPIINNPKKVPRWRYPKYSIELDIKKKKRYFLIRRTLNIVESNDNSYEVEDVYKIVIIPLAIINLIRT